MTTKRQWQRVGWWREQGVSAKWGRTDGGSPIMLVEFCGAWQALSKQAWGIIEKRLDSGDTLAEACHSAWAFIDLFSLPMRTRDIKTTADMN